MNCGASLRDSLNSSRVKIKDETDADPNTSSSNGNHSTSTPDALSVESSKELKNLVTEFEMSKNRMNECEKDQERLQKKVQNIESVLNSCVKVKAGSSSIRCQQINADNSSQSPKRANERFPRDAEHEDQKTTTSSQVVADLVIKTINSLLDQRFNQFEKVIGSLGKTFNSKLSSFEERLKKVTNVDSVHNDDHHLSPKSSRAQEDPRVEIEDDHDFNQEEVLSGEKERDLKETVEHLNTYIDRLLTENRLLKEQNQALTDNKRGTETSENAASPECIDICIDSDDDEEFVPEIEESSETNRKVEENKEEEEKDETIWAEEEEEEEEKETADNAEKESKAAAILDDSSQDKKDDEQKTEESPSTPNVSRTRRTSARLSKSVAEKELQAEETPLALRASSKSSVVVSPTPATGLKCTKCSASFLSRMSFNSHQESEHRFDISPGASTSKAGAGSAGKPKSGRKSFSRPYPLRTQHLNTTLFGDKSEELLGAKRRKKMLSGDQGSATFIFDPQED